MHHHHHQSETHNHTHVHKCLGIFWILNPFCAFAVCDWFSFISLYCFQHRIMVAVWPRLRWKSQEWWALLWTARPYGLELKEFWLWYVVFSPLSYQMWALRCDSHLIMISQEHLRMYCRFTHNLLHYEYTSQHDISVHGCFFVTSTFHHGLLCILCYHVFFAFSMAYLRRFFCISQCCRHCCHFIQTHASCDTNTYTHPRTYKWN